MNATHVERFSTEAGHNNTALHTLLTTLTQVLLNPNTTSLPDIYNSTVEDTTEDTAADVHLSLTALWLYYAVRIICGGLAIFGNGLTIVVVAKFERLQTCTNYLICSLAVVDILSGVIAPLMMVHDLLPDSWFYVPVCLIGMILCTISATGNTFFILFISIDRYIYIAYPLRYHALVTAQRTTITLIILWAYSILVIPAVLLSGSHLHVGLPCTFNDIIDKKVIYFFLSPQFMLAVLLTIGFHLRIAKIAYNQVRLIAAQQQPYDTMNVAINQSTRKISGTLALVLGVYLLAILPQYIVNLLRNKLSQASQLKAEKLSVIMYWANAWVNPLIYAWRLKDFRIAFRKLLTGTGSFNQVQPADNAEMELF